MAKDPKEMIQLLATEYGLPLSLVEKACYAGFKLTAKTMAEGKYESVRLPYLGKFHVLPGRLKRMKNVKRKTPGIRRGDGGKAK